MVVLIVVLIQNVPDMCTTLPQKMHEVGVIAAELVEKHKEKYSKEQIRCWAYMIQIKQHESYEIPPNKPLFKTKARGITPSTTCISPGKKREKFCFLSLFSNRIKWHDLKVCGIITEEQYKDFKETILASPDSGIF